MFTEVCLCMWSIYTLARLCALMCKCLWPCVCVFLCVCSQPPMTHGALSCRQAETEEEEEEEEAVFVISPGCHSAFGCCHHQCNYHTVPDSHPPHRLCLSDVHQWEKNRQTCVSLMLSNSSGKTFSCDMMSVFWSSWTQKNKKTKKHLDETLLQIKKVLSVSLFPLQHNCNLPFWL